MYSSLSILSQLTYISKNDSSYLLKQSKSLYEYLRVYQYSHLSIIQVINIQLSKYKDGKVFCRDRISLRPHLNGAVFKKRASRWVVYEEGRRVFPPLSRSNPSAPHPNQTPIIQRVLRKKKHQIHLQYRSHEKQCLSYLCMFMY